MHKVYSKHVTEKFSLKHTHDAKPGEILGGQAEDLEGQVGEEASGFKCYPIYQLLILLNSPILSNLVLGRILIKILGDPINFYSL